MKRPLALTLVVTLLLVAVPPAPAAEPPPIDGGGVTGLTLKTQLEKGLQARRPVEFQYIGQIIELVEKDELPYSLVTSTYLWAQRQPTRQLQYFQFALQTRVRQMRLTVKLPDLRRQAVGINTNGGEHGVNEGP